MRGKLLVAALAGALGVLGGWLLGRQPAPATAELPKNAEPAAPLRVMPMPRKPDFDTGRRADSALAVKTEVIVSTVRQTGHAPFPAQTEDDTITQLDELDQHLARLGLPLLFVVRAETPAEALTETLNTLNAGTSALVPQSNRNRRRLPPCPNTYWLFTYLGTFGDTPAVIIDDVWLTPQCVTVRFSPQGRQVANARTQYVHKYWIPLGELPTGAFRTILHNSAQEVDVLQLRVTIQTDAKAK